jgi:hypothetical protein
MEVIRHKTEGMKFKSSEKVFGLSGRTFEGISINSNGLLGVFFVGRGGKSFSKKT